MSCEFVRQTLLDLDWTAADRQRAATALKHLEECDACRAAVSDFDVFRDAFASGGEDVEPAGGWDAFERRIELQVAGISTHHRSWRWPLAIAASVLIAGTSFEFGRFSGGSPQRAQIVENLATTLPEEVGSEFTPGDITHEVSAFHQVSQILEGRAGWMLVSNKTSDSDVGMADRAVDTAGRVLLLRFTLLADGKVVSEADLVAIPGQTANLTVPLEPGTALHYRVGTSTDEPTHLALWAEIRKSTGREPLAALSTNVRMQPGEKLTAGELSTSAGKYVLNVSFARASLPSGGGP